MKSKRISLAVFICFYLSFTFLSSFNPGIASASPLTSTKTNKFDIVVYGGTAAGVAAATAAAREGASVALVEPSTHIGGMVSSGLAFTDKGNDRVIGGISREFFQRVGKYYNTSLSWYFEPKVAERVFNDLVRESGVELFLSQRLAQKNAVVKKENGIKQIIVENGDVFEANVFIDCSYEGDLMAQSGVSYTWGRESSSQYGESLAGVRPYTDGHNFKYPTSAYDSLGELLPGIQKEKAGEAGTGDKKIQAYNYRLCLSNVFSNRLPFNRPEDYDPNNYKLLVKWLENLKAHENYRDIRFSDVLAIGPLPGGKADINSNGPFSSDLIGGSWDYPEASYDERNKILQQHKSYLEGFLYFLANDRSIPSELRNETLGWGYAADEFLGNNNWPYALYIREARRMTSEFIMTQKDIQEDLVKYDSIGMGSYNSDSHNTQRYVSEDGYVLNEGNMEVRVSPYQIPYRVMLPKRNEARNLLVPVCLSASHVAYSTLRMEPQYMILGEAAGVAAVLALEENCSVQDVDTSYLRFKLKSQKAVLELPQSGLESKTAYSVIDNKDQGFIHKDFISVGMGGCIGYDAMAALSSDKDAFAEFPLNVKQDGEYDIYFNIPHNLKGTQKVELNFDNIVLTVDMDLSKSGWRKVSGSPFQLKTNVSNTLRIKAGGASSILVADAVKIVRTGSEYFDNVALGRTVLVDSKDSSHSGANITDGIVSDESFWCSNDDGTTHWAEISLERDYSVVGAVVYSGTNNSAPADNFVIQYYQNGIWNDIAETRTFYNSASVLELYFKKPVTTNRIRVYKASGKSLSLNEVVIYGRIAGSNPVTIDPLNPDGIVRIPKSTGSVYIPGKTADMGVDITADRLICPEGGKINFTIRYKNNSNNPARNVLIEVKNPEDAVIVEAANARQSSGSMKWELASVQPGEMGTITYSVRVGRLYYPEIISAGSVRIKCDNETAASSNDTSLFRILLYQPEKEKLLHKGYITGNLQGQFEPLKELTRAETAAILVRALGLKMQYDADAPVFKDVPKGHWAYYYINAAVKAGIFGGYSDKTFRPDNKMLKSDFAATLSKYLGYGENKPLGFEVKNLEGHWAENYILSLARLDLIDIETSGFSEPDTSITKVDAVIILNRLLNRGPLYGEKQVFTDIAPDYWYYGQIQEAGVDHTSFRCADDTEQSSATNNAE